MQVDTGFQRLARRAGSNSGDGTPSLTVLLLKLLSTLGVAIMSVATFTMEKCNKFKLFNLLLLFCTANILLYRYFSRPDTKVLQRLDLYTNKKTHFDSKRTIRNDIRNILSIDSLNSPDSGTDSSNDTRNVDNVFIQPIYDPNNLRKSGSEPRSSTVANPLTAPDTVLSTTYLSTGSSSDSLFSSQTTGLSLCPLVPPRLNGPLATYMEPSSWQQIALETTGLQPGGRYKPPGCLARHRVAIVIPYRNREEHLKILLKNLHPILSRQQLDYGVYVIDQALPGKFNRAMLMNIGYAEAMKRYDYQCVVFHDVDLVPENDENIYSCPEMPRHMSAAIDKFNYRLPYSGIYGGVSAMNKQQFEKINGFSNMYFGWGGEDDDMARRIKLSGLVISRYPMKIARYKMIKHVHDAGNERNPLRFGLLKSTAKRMATDGLNSLVYKVQAVEELPSHLRIQVLINETDILKQLKHL